VHCWQLIDTVVRCRYPYIVLQMASGEVAEYQLPHPSDFAALTVRKCTWMATDGMRITGLVCEKKGVSAARWPARSLTHSLGPPSNPTRAQACSAPL